MDGFHTVGEPVVATAVVDGLHQEGIRYRWRFSRDGAETGSWTPWREDPVESFSLAPGCYRLLLHVQNDSGEEAWADDGRTYCVPSPVVYVVPPEAASGPPAYPYDQWGRAATNLPMAVAAAGNGSRIIVTNGAYGLTEPFVIAADIHMESVEGPGKTSIYRAYPRTSAYPSFRPVSILGKGAFFGGITVSNSIVHTDIFGGAALYCQDATVSNCVFSFNQLDWATQGGTVMNTGGHVTHCVFHENKGGGPYGFGIYQNGKGARTDHCVIHGNSNILKDQGYYCQGSAVINGGVLSDCIITNNMVEMDNRGSFSAGVTLFDGIVCNCLVAMNQGGSGAGGIRAIGGAVVNCTIVSNYVSGLRGIRSGGVAVVLDRGSKDVGITNCIIYGNRNATADGTMSNGDNIAVAPGICLHLSHTLLDNWKAIDSDAEGCLAADPLFQDAADGDWRLARKSPCRDAGVTLDFMLDDLDLDGRPRVVHRDRVDLGCYEASYVSPAMILMIR